ncbi:MAG: OadG family protein [Chloroflexota bacterium]|nr:OadG family protein [Chloroflexota bacterium]
MLNIDWSVVAYGAQITVVGMGLVFLALGLIVLSMVILTRLTGSRSEEGGGEASAGGVEVSSSGDVLNERARVAAIAVALALSEEHTRPALTPPTSGQASAWKMQGRIIQLQQW